MQPPPADILDRLPHRPPFRFLSEITKLSPGELAEGIWRVEGHEAFFQGHFPGQPIVPGVLIAEALAQLSGLIVFVEPASHTTITEGANRPSTGDVGHRPADGSTPAHLAHVDVRLQSAVVPPAELALQSRLARTLGALWQFDVKATAEGRIAARGQLTLARATGAKP